MIKEPRELKIGQIVVAPPTKGSTSMWRDSAYYEAIERWRFGTVGKHISGVPHPGVFIKWDNGLGTILEYKAKACWDDYHVVNTEQEKLALMMKLS